jgi:hypothetical protein
LNFYRLKGFAADGVGLASAALRHIGARFCPCANNKIGGSMFRLHNHAGLIAGVLVAASITMAATASSAGLWSVSIVTKKGDCIASYRYPMRIANGVLANGGDIAIDVSGKVAADGAVTVVVSHGDTRASGSGRLAANAGNGSWRTSSCSGSWTAERRS